MNAVIQLANTQLIPTLEPDGHEWQPSQFTSPETPVEQRLAWALSCLAQLQARRSELQAMVLEAERELLKKEMLLHNATIREQELRAQLGAQLMRHR